MSQVILFDLDGTLTESGEGITKCVQYALKKMGIVENDLKKLECFIGPPLKDSFVKYGGLSEEKAIEAIAYYRERYEKEGIFENRLYPKISDLLELLQINDKIMGVASAKPEPYVKQILEHFGIASYFKTIVGSEMNGARVTKTEVIEEALIRLHMQTERDKVVMVGDRAEDVRGALTCGIQCLGVLYGYGSEEELKQAGAVYLAEDVEDLAVLASPSDEETTEHVESIRQNDLNEMVFVPEEEVTDAVEANLGDTLTKTKAKKAKVAKLHPIHHLWRWFYPLALYLIISVAVTLCSGIYFAVTLLVGSESYDVELLIEKILNTSLLQTMIAGVLMAVISLFLYRSDQKKREYEIFGSGKTTRWCPAIAWLVVFVISIAGCQFLNDVIEIVGLHELFPTYTDVADQTIYSQPVWLILLTVGVVAPVSEELLFRGLLFSRMKDWIKPWLAVVFSAAFFGLYHGNVVQFIYAFLMGILFAVIYHRTGVLRTTIVAHMVANLWSVLGYGFVKEAALNIEYGRWIVIGVCAVLCLLPTTWLVCCKRKNLK